MGPDINGEGSTGNSSIGSFHFSIPNGSEQNSGRCTGWFSSRLDRDGGIAYLATNTCSEPLGEGDSSVVGPFFSSANSWWNMNNPLQFKTTGITDSPELVDIEKPEQGLELHVGSNVFRNTNGVVKLQGKEQLVLETQLEPLMLLLTMDLYDDQGTRVGHIRRNALSAHSAGRYTINVTDQQRGKPGRPSFSHRRRPNNRTHGVRSLPHAEKKNSHNRGPFLYS